MLIHMNRWMRADVRGSHCITTICEEDDIGQTPSSQYRSQGRNCRNSRLDSEMLHARAVGGKTGTELSQKPTSSLIFYNHSNARVTVDDIGEVQEEDRSFFGWSI